MASESAAEVFSPQNVLAGMVTMRGHDASKKKAAMDYLAKFQKSESAWSVTITILQSSVEAEAMLFAATTLKGKITFDLTTQVRPDDLPGLRNQILLLLKKFAPGPRPVRIQLCVCLAILAIQMTEWKDVLATVVSALGSDVESHACILDFLRVLPEEVTEGRKITLSEEELADRTRELLGDNAEQVIQLLTSYAQSSPAAAKNPLLLECITSWLREVPVNTIVNSPLLNVIISAIGSDDSIQAAADCLGSLCRETRDVDDNLETIQALLPRIIELRPNIRRFAEDEDKECFKSLTLLFADAGDSWVVAIAREPIHFRPLVDALLECAALDKECDVIRYTFGFWYELKQYLVLERYIESRLQLVDVYSKLVDILLQRLQYPPSETGDDTVTDLFDGDREQEEKFREFRHHMGDTLKDACEVMGVTECLTKVLNAIRIWMQTYASQVSATSVPHWQELEAPLFSMRALGRMVGKKEESVLPQLMPLLVQIPNHEKLRFATIMVFGRYTEWTTAHPTFLEPQFNFIVSSFQSESKEIIRAAAQAIKFFCTDCRELLSGQVVQMQQFYDQILDKLPEMSQEEMTEGVASVVAVQDPGDVYKLLKLYCDPLIERLMRKANAATTEGGKLAVADHLQLITIFVQNVIPSVPKGQENPAVKYWSEVFHVLSTVLENFLNFTPICERVCRCWRFMIISYRTDMTPLLAAMANKLAEGFTVSKQGCFLWVTGAILREFSENREHVEAQITESIYVFFESQATSVLRVMSALPPAELPDVIEDFFRLLVDALLYYPHKLIPSALFTPIFEAAISALALEQRDPLSATLHYLRDLLTYGGSNPAQSGGLPAETAAQLRLIVQQLLAVRGEVLVKQVLAGMMITFPRDCFADGSGVLLSMFELLPAETTAWLDRTLQMLPAGTVAPDEVSRLIVKIRDRLQNPSQGGLRQVRALLQDFTNSYRRRYIAPRDGLGELEATRFHFAG
ncbi:mRNA transport regulator [Grosmannia clavigera kw1407]|uniref:mRNA transport regulator n=1 Tax=Grosmannia clavigera (strain kw1407 / UAMH 11150) TaxID=655863 RepID=F0X965_GROCL|nr:mRNA transport regulator [Grosmannia clavigera kw1407]EFX05450.1 mRNA transport regulator [Grosmannia clavigera kw1407]